MQIILVSRHLKAARTFTIMPWHVVATLLVFLALVFSTSALFSWLSVHLRLPLIEDLLVKLQLQESQKTRNYLDNNLQLMATRLGSCRGRCCNSMPWVIVYPAWPASSARRPSVS